MIIGIKRFERLETEGRAVTAEESFQEMLFGRRLVQVLFAPVNTRQLVVQRFKEVLVVLVSNTK